MRVCVVDGRGGGLGTQLITRLRRTIDADHDIIGIGTNGVAAAAMARAGAGRTVVGPRAGAHSVQQADVIVGALSIIVPGAFWGELKAELAAAIAHAPARKVLLPVNRCNMEVVGTESPALEPLIARAVDRVHSLLTTPVLL